MLPDDVIAAEKPCLKQMVDLYQDTGGNIIAVEEVPEDQTDQYGIVELAGEISANAHKISNMVEKPAPGTAPSNLMITGRYILQPEIFDLLSNQGKGAGGEIQLTDSMLALMKEQNFASLKFEGRSYDCGNKAGFLSANIAFGMDDPKLARELVPFMEEIIRKPMAAE